MNTFDYHLAFSRNIGWITEIEQQQLRGKKIAIAGMGGVGGFHLLTLVRLGLENFHIADFDEFEIHNFNRQIGASMLTINQNKAETLSSMARDINPNVKIKIFSKGVNPENANEFLTDVDLYVDGLDFFVPTTRELIFKKCHELKIPAITAGPIGMGTAYFVFMPDGMSFEEYFRFEGLSEMEKYINFTIGVTPHMLPIKYLVDPLAASLVEKRGPSTVMACELCSGVIGTEALKILLNRGPLYPAPYYHFFDAYYGKFIRRKLRWGNKHPLQYIKRYIIKKIIGKPKDTKPTVHSVNNPPNDITKILDVSRWTPSADNSQPWRFKIIDESSAQIHLIPPPESSILNDNGITTALSCGMLLETIRLAATSYKRHLTWSVNQTNNNIINLQLPRDEHIEPEMLAEFIPYRSVDRRSYRSEKLNPDTEAALSSLFDEQLEMRWFDSTQDRWHFSKLNMLSTKIRLRSCDLLDLTHSIIDSNHFSQTAIPLNSLGLNFLSKSIFQWALQDKSRLHFIIKYFGADILTGIELDLIPGMMCGAHFAILSRNTSKNEMTNNQLMLVGMQIQRFWLSLTKHGLVMQPNYAPILFTNRIGNTIPSTNPEKILKMERTLIQQYNHYFDTNKLLFLGRIGRPILPHLPSRSIRKPLTLLLEE